MFAIIETGGKQYKVASGDVLKIEKLEAEAGKTIEIGKVLMVHDGGKSTTGTPAIEGASVSAEVIAHQKEDKIIIFKKKRRQNYRRKNGHRQNVTVIKITGIKGG